MLRAKREWPGYSISPLIDVQIGNELDFVQLRSPLEERNSTHTEALDTKLVTCYNGRHDIISNTLPTSDVRSHQS